jgi:hypothetical protein
MIHLKPEHGFPGWRDTRRTGQRQNLHFQVQIPAFRLI